MARTKFVAGPAAGVRATYKTAAVAAMAAAEHMPAATEERRSGPVGEVAAAARAVRVLMERTVETAMDGAMVVGEAVREAELEDSAGAQMGHVLPVPEPARAAAAVAVGTERHIGASTAAV